MDSIWKRLLRLLLTMLIVSLAVFSFISFSSGDSSSSVLSEDASEEAIEAYRKAMGLDEPFAVRYLSFLSSFFSGNWGVASDGQDISFLVLSRIPATLSITILALLMSLAIALSLAFLSLRRHTIGRALTTAWAAVMMSSPVFLIAIALVLLLSFQLDLFPVAGYVPLSGGFVRSIRSVFLPSLSLALLHSSLIMLMMRAAVESNLSASYSMVARAFGKGFSRIAAIDASKPALPLLAILSGQSAAAFIGGSAAVETLFAIPGIGSLLVTAALRRDAALAGTLVMLIALSVSCISMAAEAVSALLDPRRER